LTGDQTVISKPGKKTSGLDRFFSSLCDKAVPAVTCFSIALIHVGKRYAYSHTYVQSASPLLCLPNKQHKTPRYARSVHSARHTLWDVFRVVWLPLSDEEVVILAIPGVFLQEMTLSYVSFMRPFKMSHNGHYRHRI